MRMYTLFVHIICLTRNGKNVVFFLFLLIALNLYTEIYYVFVYELFFFIHVP